MITRPTSLFRMKHLAIILLLIIIGSIYTQPINAAKPPEKTNEGTEFWLCFERNYKNSSSNAPKKSKHDIHLELFIAGNKESKVSIEIDGINFRRDVKVSSGVVSNVIVDSAAQVLGEEIPERLAVHVVSDNPIIVYGLSSRWQTTDTYMGIPVSALGSEYRVIGYKYSEGLCSQFAIIATEDETKVTITPTVKTSKLHPANKPFSIKLRRGDVYQVTSLRDSTTQPDLTGSHINADKKIAVFSGHQCSYVPQGVVGCNHLVEQLPPITTWGKNYYVGMLSGRLGYSVRVLASHDNTKVSFDNPKLVVTLDAGQFYENSNATQNTKIISDHPILVTQYSHGFLSGDSVGDPMMLIVSPEEQFLKEYRFATPKNGSWKHHVNIIIPSDATRSIKLDSQPIDFSVNKFQKLDGTSYSIAQIQVDFGAHTIVADELFGMYSYGFGFGDEAYDAYGNMGGQSFIEINP